jgi:hypothetical protein
MNNFNIKDDLAKIKSGCFWCKACLVARPIDDISPDPRYCQSCYDVLVYEASLLPKRGINRRPGWIPQQGCEIKATNKGKVQFDVSANLSTVKRQKNEVDKLPSRPPKEKPGPKSIDLPDDMIRRLAYRGLGSKAIARALATQGVSVSYRTIQRRLQGVLI